jgi:hypothetical protein
MSLLDFVEPKLFDPGKGVCVSPELLNKVKEQKAIEWKQINIEEKQKRKESCQRKEKKKVRSRNPFRSNKGRVNRSIWTF